MLNERQLFLFWQFNGDNRSFCNQHCPYCYGKDNRTYKHYWNGRIEEWEKAFERLNRDIYFVMSYGEPMSARGFYECVEMIGKHPTWTLCLITNLSYSPARLIGSRLGKEKRVFVIACWHPLGVEDRYAGWEKFTKHLFMLQAADIPIHASMVWYKPQIKWIPDYFDWLDKHNFRFGVRRYVDDKLPLRSKFLYKILRQVSPKSFAGKITLAGYTDAERRFIYAYTSPKVTKYGLNLANTYGIPCAAGKDMILVHYDGTVKPCACCVSVRHKLGNIFDRNYKLNNGLMHCPTNSCGGDFGMFHIPDDDFGPLPKRLWRDTFISQMENIPHGVKPVPYPRREEMLKWLEEIRREQSLS